MRSVRSFSIKGMTDVSIKNKYKPSETPQGFFPTLEKSYTLQKPITKRSSIDFLLF